jgi:hypothetical protein
MSDKVKPVDEREVVWAPVMVKPECDGEKSSGRWICTTHNKMFENQFQKDTHIHTGTHRLAWFCHAHGVEVP